MKMSEHLQHEASYRGNMNVLKQRSGKKIVVLGAGALGSFLVDLLARQGYEQMTVVDRDKVERSNFGTQNYGKSDIGRAKANQCAQNVMKRIGVKVMPVVKDINESNVNPLLSGADLIIDLFDNPTSRRVVKNAADRWSIPCVHAGMGAIGYFEVVWNENYNIPEESGKDGSDAPCDYPLASNLVMLCVGGIAEVVNRFVDEGQKISIDFWLSKMKMGEM